MRREFIELSRCTVTQLMADMGLQSVFRGKPLNTSLCYNFIPCPLYHFIRQFRVSRPNVLWVSDFTYVATWTGFVYGPS